MKELNIALSNELAAALINLRQEDESLEQTAARVIIEARKGHVAPPPEGTGSHETAPAT